MIKTRLDQEQIDAHRKNFDELMDWMRENGASLTNQAEIKGFGTFSLYRFQGDTVIVHEYDCGNGASGWQFYKPITDMSWEGTKRSLQEIVRPKS